MNFLLNRLDNLNISNKSFEFVPNNIKKEMNIDGMIVGTDGKLIVQNHDVMDLIKKSNIQRQIGINMYDALMRKPMMIFLLPTQEEEFGRSLEELDEYYGMKLLFFNNLAQAFSLGCWFVKDSCIAAVHAYWFNMFNGYNSQAKREIQVTLGNGHIAAVKLSDSEMEEAIKRMYEVCWYLSPEESKMGKVNKTRSMGTMVWEIDKAISTEGNSFARALIRLQEARRTGMLASKIDKYCSVLECLFAIRKNHKQNISRITAAYIGENDEEKEEIIKNLREAYGVRSDGSHGSKLNYLKKNNEESLEELSSVVDDYTRRVFRKIIINKDLNYDTSAEKEAATRKYFHSLI